MVKFTAASYDESLKVSTGQAIDVLWSKYFDGQENEPFALQSVIGEEIVVQNNYKGYFVIQLENDNAEKKFLKFPYIIKVQEAEEKSIRFDFCKEGEDLMP